MRLPFRQLFEATLFVFGGAAYLYDTESKVVAYVHPCCSEIHVATGLREGIFLNYTPEYHCLG